MEPLRRFLLHVLPGGFHKIRHYGLYASSLVDSKLVDARRLLDAARPCTRPEAREAPPAWPELLCELTGRDVDVCPKCGGHLQHLPLERSTAVGTRGCRVHMSGLVKIHAVPAVARRRMARPSAA